jgi:hypothetical protein
MIDDGIDADIAGMPAAYTDRRGGVIHRASLTRAETIFPTGGVFPTALEIIFPSVTASNRWIFVTIYFDVTPLNHW